MPAYTNLICVFTSRNRALASETTTLLVAGSAALVVIFTQLRPSLKYQLPRLGGPMVPVTIMPARLWALEPPLT